MVISFVGIRRMIWRLALGLLFVLAVIQLCVPAHQAEAGLLSPLTILAGNPNDPDQPDIDPMDTNSPSSELLGAVGALLGADKSDRDEPVSSESPLIEIEAGGGGLLPDLQLTLPPIVIETPLIKVDIPSVQVKLEVDPLPQLSVDLPALRIDSEIVEVKTPVLESAITLDIQPGLQVHVETPFIQVKAPLIPIQIPGVAVHVDLPESVEIRLPEESGPIGGHEEPPPIVGPVESAAVEYTSEDSHSDLVVVAAENAKQDRLAGPLEKASITLPPVAIQPDVPVSKSAPDDSSIVGNNASCALPSELMIVIERLPGDKPDVQWKSPVSAPSGSTAAPDWPQAGVPIPLSLGVEAVSVWFSPANSTNSTQSGASFTIGSAAVYVNTALLHPDTLLQPPRIMDQSYCRSQLLAANQWSKPPPGQPPRLVFFSSNGA